MVHFLSALRFFPGLEELLLIMCCLASSQQQYFDPPIFGDMYNNFIFFWNRFWPFSFFICTHVLYLVEENVSCSLDGADLKYTINNVSSHTCKLVCWNLWSELLHSYVACYAPWRNILQVHFSWLLVLKLSDWKQDFIRHIWHHPDMKWFRWSWWWWHWLLTCLYCVFSIPTISHKLSEGHKIWKQPFMALNYGTDVVHLIALLSMYLLNVRSVLITSQLAVGWETHLASFCSFWFLYAFFKLVCMCFVLWTLCIWKSEGVFSTSKQILK